MWKTKWRHPKQYIPGYEDYASHFCETISGKMTSGPRYGYCNGRNQCVQESYN